MRLRYFIGVEQKNKPTEFFEVCVEKGGIKNNDSKTKVKKIETIKEKEKN